MVRVLHAVPDMGAGGIENYVMNMYRRIDPSEVSFDFLVHHRARAFFDDEIEARGGRIFRLPVLDDKNVPAYLAALRRLFAQREWDVVHGHAASLAGLYLGAAERAGVPARIAHSHGASFLRTPKGYAKMLLFKGAARHANIRLACSTEAGRYLFGEAPFHLAKNAIDPARFAFDPAARGRARTELGVSAGQLVVGHVGRFNLQKNHRFLVEAFSELSGMRPDARLALVGAGETQADVRRQVSALGLSGKVSFLPVTDRPQDLYTAMDVFVLPSLFEGLPLVGVEAQASGLPCVFSSEVTREVQISPEARFVDLAAGPRAWAEAVLEARPPADRSRAAAQVAAHGFDVAGNTERMARFYRAAAEGRLDSVDAILG